MKRLASFISVLFLTTLFFTSCEDTGTTQLNEEASYDLAITADESIVAAEVNQITSMVEEAADYARNSSARIRFSYCASTDINWEGRSITLDFGGGCSVEGGRVSRSGKILVTFADGDVDFFSGPRTVQFENYRFNGLALAGSLALTVPVSNSNGFSLNRTTAITVEFPLDNIEISESAFRKIPGTGEEIQDLGPTFALVSQQVPFSYNATHLFTKIGDEISITGNAHGFTRANVGFTIAISQALVFKPSCEAQGVVTAVSGVKNITVGRANFSVNHGDGSCSSSVNIRAGAISFNHTLGF
jgi:hypothetical protein